MNQQALSERSRFRRRLMELARLLDDPTPQNVGIAKTELNRLAQG